MKCPYCGAVGASRVVDTTHDSRGGIRRRRECKNCGERFSSYERAILSTPMLIKSGGEREPFDREKLIQGMRIACAKRPVAAADLERLADQIETNLQRMGKAEVSSRVVGDMVIEGLKALDAIAYIRYAIVYLRLDNLDSVREEINKLLEDQSSSSARTGKNART
ncbi:MAG: transcriptional regulator NrdR [Anaerolineae bacterium]